jgi:hypothetical protein
MTGFVTLSQPAGGFGGDAESAMSAAESLLFLSLSLLSPLSPLEIKIKKATARSRKFSRSRKFFVVTMVTW